MTRTTLLAMVMMVGGAQLAHAQGAPRMVSGRVFDDSTGCPLTSAKVTAGTGTISAVTDAHGRYRLANPPTESFSLRVTLAGFQPQQADDVTVTDSTERVDFSLPRAFRDGSTQVAYPKAACRLEPRDSL